MRHVKSEPVNSAVAEHAELNGRPHGFALAVLVKGLVQVAVGLLGLVQQRWPSTSNLATAATRAVNSSASAWRIWSTCSARKSWCWAAASWKHWPMK